MPFAYREEILKNSMSDIPIGSLVSLNEDEIGYLSINDNKTFYTGVSPQSVLHVQRENNTLNIDQPTNLDMDSLVEKMWKKMFEKPAIISCRYCHSHNAYTNSNCVSCGSPMGDSS